MSNIFDIHENWLCQRHLIARKSNSIKMNHEGGDKDGTRQADKKIQDGSKFISGGISG